MEIPEQLRYSADHEWARAEGERITVGITDFAQEALGDVVFVELPAVGAELARGAMLGEVESTKSVSEIYAPVSGRVTDVNSALAETPERLNEDPYGQGWICVIEASDPAELDSLLDAAAYRELTIS
jgi:glycine cleavage system H protein